MTAHSFDYEDVFMGVREKKPTTYLRTFAQDYRLRSLTDSVVLGKGKLLDIGCGGGLISETLPYYYPKGEIYGCDVSKTAVAFAKKLGSGKVKYAEIINKRFPYKDIFFDVCICLDVLEHVPDIDYFLEEAKRVLKKDGNFFLIVPCEGQPFTYTWLFQKIHVGKNLTRRYFGHIHPEFTHKKVITIFKKHGFVIQKTAYSEHIFYQFMHLLLFTVPKVLLEIFLGGKSNEYTNSSLIRNPKANNDILMIIRKYWFKVFYFFMTSLMYWETIALKRLSIAAWKLHLLATVKKDTYRMRSE